jgi:hypothetical protein
VDGRCEYQRQEYWDNDKFDLEQRAYTATTVSAKMYST